MRKNETKLLILDVLVKFGPGPWYKIQEWVNRDSNLDLSDGSVKMCLCRLYRWHLVKRRGGIYTITDLGRQRLDWILQQKAKKLEETGFIGSTL